MSAFPKDARAMPHKHMERVACSRKHLNETAPSCTCTSLSLQGHFFLVGNWLLSNQNDIKGVIIER